MFNQQIDKVVYEFIQTNPGSARMAIVNGVLSDTITHRRIVNSINRLLDSQKIRKDMPSYEVYYYDNVCCDTNDEYDLDY